MKRFLKFLAIVLGSAALLFAAFFWIYAPLRAKNLAAQYEQFRAEHQAGTTQLTPSSINTTRW